MGAGAFLELAVGANAGAPRTGHVTLSGDGLYTQLTITQAGS